MTKTNNFNNWLSGFIFGQHIYKSKNKGKEMLISLPKNNVMLETLKGLFKEESYIKGGRDIIKLKNQKLDKILNNWPPTDLTTDFIIGLMESCFDVFVERENKAGKIKTRQYIKLPNHIIVKNALAAAKIKYKDSNSKSIKITARAECAKFLKTFDTERFLIYRDELTQKQPHK